MKKVSVVIGRFQVPALHIGHKHLIDCAVARGDDLLILLGTSPAFPTVRNPLPYRVREAMMRQAYPRAIIAPLPDHPSDAVWSTTVDRLVQEVFPGHMAQLYGSRDSFISYYTGALPVTTVPNIAAPTGTEVRKENGSGIFNSMDFRSGMIHAQHCREGISYQTVDIAIVRHSDKAVLVGQKTHDGKQYRFLGGFVDPHDDSLESAALRELGQEGGRIDCHKLHYLGSYRVDDFRYHNENDQVMTTFFAAYYFAGAATAGDDIAEVAWVPYGRLFGLVVAEHRPLAERLVRFVEAGQ